MSLPHVNQLDRDAIEDLGVIDDDRTEMSGIVRNHGLKNEAAD
jgi:hypothetical protein